MNGIVIGDPTAETPPPSQEWRDLPVWARIVEIKKCFPGITVLRATDVGDITIKWPGEDQPAAARGEMMRRMEALLRERFGGVYLYLQPQADRNVIRNLRGVNLDESM